MIALVADQDPQVRDAWRCIVCQLEGGARVLEAGDYATLLEHFADAVDLLLVDLHMSRMNGIGGLHRLRVNFPKLAIVVASGQHDATTIRAGLAAGINGFIAKLDSPDLVLPALRLVRAGGNYIPPGALGDLRNGSHLTACNGSHLTARQLDVLRRLLKGEPNKVIARQLGVVEGTVKIHIAGILRALQVHNRTQAVVRARELGLG
jgi:DNA-binding NarL/FixJ family response regulator